MTLMSIIISALLALVFSVLLFYGFRRRIPDITNGLLFLFIIIFMFTWAVGAWLTPVGPSAWGVSWLGYLLIAVLVMLLLAAILPPAEPGSPTIPEPGSEEEREVKEETKLMTRTFGIFFWILVIALFAFAIFGLSSSGLAGLGGQG